MYRLWLALLGKVYARLDKLYTLELRFHGVKLGRGVRAMGRARVLRVAGDIVLHDGVLLRSRDFGYHTQIAAPTKLFTDAPGALIEVFDRCRLNGVSIHAKLRVTIGRDCYFAAGTTITDCNGHVLDAAGRVRGEVDAPEPVTIGNRVWLAQSVIVLKGVTIGDDVVVAAGSVVTKDLPANTLCGGQPARVIRELTPDAGAPAPASA